MALSRYSQAPRLNFGRQYGTSQATNIIRTNVKSGVLATKEVILRGAERLDTLAGSFYGDGRLWWILAAASDIGWGLQVPPGTIILVPDLADVSNLIG